VAWLLDQGRLDNEIRRELRSRFPLEQPNSIEAAIRAGQQAWGAGTAMQIADDPTFRLTAQDVPRSGVGRNLWCYWVTIQTETSGGMPIARTVRVDFSSSATGPEVEAGALQAVVNMHLARTGRPGYDAVTADAPVTGIEYHGVERC
jgi:hypothetical protein